MPEAVASSLMAALATAAVGASLAAATVTEMVLETVPPLPSSAETEMVVRPGSAGMANRTVSLCPLLSEMGAVLSSVSSWETV